MRAGMTESERNNFLELIAVLRTFPVNAARHQLYVPADVLERHHVPPDHAV